MTIADFPAFSARLAEISELFDASLTESKYLLYFQGLEDLSFEEVDRALRLAVRKCKFMPRPSELRTFVVGDSETNCERAWVWMRAAMGAVGSYRSLIIDDGALGETIRAVFGGWPAACTVDFSHEMWASTRKAFSRVYGMYVDSGVRGSRYLPGIVEIQNAAREEWSQYIETMRLSTSGTITPVTFEEAAEHRRRLTGATGFAGLGHVAHADAVMALTSATDQSAMNETESALPSTESAEAAR